ERDVSRAKREHDVAARRVVGERVGERGTLPAPRHRMPHRARRVGDEIRGDAGDRLLARWIDLSEEHRVRRRQRARELVSEVARAREQVRLERDDEAPPGERRTRRPERRFYLGWVVRVVVDDVDAGRRAESLEATL